MIVACKTPVDDTWYVEPIMVADNEWLIVQQNSGYQ